MANRRTDLRLGSLDIEKIFENANINSQNGKINLGAIASGEQSSVTSVEVGEIQSVNSVRMFVDGILLAQLSGTNPFSGLPTANSFYFNTNLIPGLDEEYDIGSSTLKWRDLYLSGNTIFLGNTKLQTNGSTLNFINSINQTKVVASTDDIPTNETFIQAALADSNFVSSVTGPQGAAGPQGIQGLVGPQGNTGLPGVNGADGPQGPTGPQGSQGTQGSVGPTGPQGLQGLEGPQGPQGLQGNVGPTGPTGAQGPEGIQGQAGSGITFQGSVALETDLPTNGVQGDAYLVQDDDSLHIHDGSVFVDGGSIQGPQGPQGIQGAQGVAGPQGPAGPQGLQGVAGSAGADGSTGPQGDIGPQGIQGVTGPQGPAGANGAAGASVTTLAISNNTVATALSDGTNISGSVAMDLTSLSDVDITDTAHTLSDGYVLTYDSTHSHWHPEPVSSTAANISLNDLSDLSTTNVIAENTLVYDGTSWVNSFTKETVEANIQDINFSAGSWSTLNVPHELSNNQITWDYAIRVNITVLPSLGNITITLPTPSEANLGKTIEFIFPPQHPTPSYPYQPYAHTKTASGNAVSVDFVDDGSFTTATSPIYYRFENSRAVTFKLTSVNGSLKYKAIRNRPYNLTDDNKLFKNDTEIFISDSGTDGNINFTTDGTSRWDITSSGHIIPATNATYDIGEAENKVRHLFLSDNSIKFESGDIGADAEGDLTYTKTGETVSKVATQVGNLLTVKGDTTSAAIKLNCEDNSHGVTIQSPAHSEQASYTLTLPSDAGSADQVLKTDGSGGLGWVDQSGGGASVDGGFTPIPGPLTASLWNGRYTTFVIYSPNGTTNNIVATMPSQGEHNALLNPNYSAFRFIYSFMVVGGTNVNYLLELPDIVRVYGLSSSGYLQGPTTVALEKYKIYTFAAYSNRGWYLVNEKAYLP